MEEFRSTQVNALFEKPLHGWWTQLQSDAGDRAILRRCTTLDEVALSAPYQRFYRYMLACGWSANASEAQRDRLAAIAGLLAYVKEADGCRLPQSMSPLDSDKPKVSELRFRSLLRIDNVDELFASLRRVLPMIGHRTSVAQLARDIYWWDDSVKKAWAYSYRWPVK